jgi:hypothetical protein
MKQPARVQNTLAASKPARPVVPPAPANLSAQQRQEWTIRLDRRPPHKATIPLGCDSGGGEGGCG